MKKFLLSFITLLTLSLLSLSMSLNVYAEETYVTLKTFETKDGDTIKFDRSNLYNYRIVINEEKMVEPDLRNLNWGTIKMEEATYDYLFYGSMQEGNDFNTQKPFIVKVKKDFSSHIVYFNDDVEGMGYVLNLLEFPIGQYIATELVKNGDFSFFGYTGEYKLISYDDNLDVIASIDCGTKESKLSIAYDVIEVEMQDGSLYYFDKEFNMLETYEKEVNKVGYFEIYNDMYVNDIATTKGTSFNIPGVYRLNDEVHEEVTINLDALVTGIEDGGVYRDYVEYRISGGTVTLNGESVYLNGLISETGEYELKIKGLDGYEKVYHFTVSPKLITDVEDGGTLYIGDEIVFTGYARINDGEYITGSYNIEESGTYKLSLYANKSGDAQEVLYFNVPEVQIRKEDKTWVYIVLSLSALGMGVGIFLMIYIENRKKRLNSLNLQ